MVALEAWALGRPVLANARCDVLRGQCVRSKAGLYYDGEDEFVEALRALERTEWLAHALGRSGRRFFRENYDWSVIVRKYLDILERLSREPGGRAAEPLPGWLDRRRRSCPPAAEVMAQLPVGPAPADPTDVSARPAHPEHPVPTPISRERGTNDRRRFSRHHRGSRSGAPRPGRAS
jgi:hypothetical protein